MTKTFLPRFLVMQMTKRTRTVSRGGGSSSGRCSSSPWRRSPRAATSSSSGSWWRRSGWGRSPTSSSVSTALLNRFLLRTKHKECGNVPVFCFLIAHCSAQASGLRGLTSWFILSKDHAKKAMIQKWRPACCLRLELKLEASQITTPHEFSSPRLRITPLFGKKFGKNKKYFLTDKTLKLISLFHSLMTHDLYLL